MNALEISMDSYTPNVKEKVQKRHDPSAAQEGLEGEVCTICGETRKTSPISAMDYAINRYADQMIKAAKPGQKITLEFGEFNSFPRYMMEKVAGEYVLYRAYTERRLSWRIRIIEMALNDKH